MGAGFPTQVPLRIRLRTSHEAGARRSHSRTGAGAPKEEEEGDGGAAFSNGDAELERLLVVSEGAPAGDLSVARVRDALKRAIR